MAVTISLYNNATKRLANKEITLTTLKAMLLNNTATFDGANATLAAVAGAGNTKQVSGNGWTAGGVTLTNVAVTTVTTNDAKLDADDVVVTATGGPIGPAYACVVYDDTDVNDAPLFYIDFGSAQTAGDTTDFKIVWHTDGIITFTYT